VSDVRFRMDRDYWAVINTTLGRRTSCLRARVRSRSSWMDVGGTKLARMSHVEVKKAA